MNTQISTIATNADFKVNMQTGEAFISQRKTAEITGIPAATIRDWLKADREKAEIENSSRTYTVNEKQALTPDTVYKLLLDLAGSKTVSRDQALKVLAKLHKLNSKDIRDLPSPIVNIRKSTSNEVNTKGYIYVMQSNEFIKIGCSKHKDVSERLSSLQTGNPVAIELIHVHKVTRMFTAENNIHKHFAKYRVRGEWFLVDNIQTVIDFINKIK